MQEAHPPECIAPVDDAAELVNFSQVVPKPAYVLNAQR